MQKKLTETTAVWALGMAPERKLLPVTSGQYQGRLAVVVQTAPGQLQLSWSDQPYNSWSSPVTVASNAADSPFDCIMAPDGAIQLVYTEDTTKHLVTKRLPFSKGEWSTGATVTVYDQYESYFPSVGIETDGRLWVSFSRKTGGFYYLHAKTSDDDGATWGTGPSDDGDVLTSGASSVYSRLCVGPSDVFAVYTTAGNSLTVRRRPIQQGQWDDPVDIATSVGNLDDHFDAGLSESGLLGVVYDAASLMYREFDGVNWGPIASIDDDESIYPQLLFSDNVPVLIYLSETAAGQVLVKYSTRRTGAFSSPAALIGGARQFDSVVLYHDLSATYADLTEAAADGTTGDVYHPASAALVMNVGDAVYLGMDAAFRFARLLLSSAGAGGTVAYSYWDGSSWKAFTPAGGTYHLDAVDHHLLLWEDSSQLPPDWQRKTVNEHNRFFIRIQVLTAFATAPVGSQITAVPETTALIVRR